MSIKTTSIVTLQRQLSSTVCQLKVLVRAFDAMWDGEVDEEEANGFTEGFSDVVDRLKDVSKTLDTLKESDDVNTVSKVTYLQR